MLLQRGIGVAQLFVLPFALRQTPAIGWTDRGDEDEEEAGKRKDAV